MKIKVDRKWKKEGYTIGVLYINGVKICETCEDTDRGLNSSMSVEEIQSKKVYGKTAIPTGVYRVVLSVSQKFRNREWAKKYGGQTPELLNIPGFSGVRIHPGNSAESSLGCLLPGDNKAVGKVLNSQKRYFEIMDKYILPAVSRKEEITITIK